MGDFQSLLSDSARLGIQDALAKVVSGLQPDTTTSSGAFVANGSFASKKTISYNVSALASNATQSLDPTLANVFTYTVPGAVSINALSVVSGEPLFFAFTQGVSGVSAAITFGTNFKSTAALNTGNVASAKEFIMQFISDGLNYCEVSRTTAM